MDKGLVAKASVSIHAPIVKVWDALIEPEMIRQYMFGTEVVSDWKEGSPIVWKGVWEGTPYEDKGVILKLKPEQILQYTHVIPIAGPPDTREDHHTVTFELTRQGEETLLSISQDNNRTETEREHSEKMWKTMLNGLNLLLKE